MKIFTYWAKVEGGFICCVPLTWVGMRAGSGHQSWMIRHCVHCQNSEFCEENWNSHEFSWTATEGSGCTARKTVGDAGNFMDEFA